VANDNKQSDKKHCGYRFFCDRVVERHGQLESGEKGKENYHPVLQEVKMRKGGLY